MLAAANANPSKVTRDRIMRELDQAHPGYGFGQHKGYGTASHMAAIRAKGPVAGVHRRSFAPLKTMTF